MQIDPMNPMLKALGYKHLRLEHYNLLSKFAFNFNLRRYIEAEQDELVTEWDQLERLVGRDRFKTALMALATATLRKRLKKDAEAYYLSEFLIDYKKRQETGAADDMGKRFFKVGRCRFRVTRHDLAILSTR